jgi:hypothetical protein
MRRLRYWVLRSFGHYPHIDLEKRLAPHTNTMTRWI